MADICCKRFRAHGVKVNAIEVRLYYHLGGVNYLTYKNDARGYYASFSPVLYQTRNGYTTIETAVLSGFKVCLKPVQRASVKAKEEAVKLLHDKMRKYIDFLCERECIELDTTEEGDLIEL